MIAGDSNNALFTQWLAQLDSIMDTILIVERLDESLAVMAQHLNWGASDVERAKLIAYLPVNVHKKP
jgi:hypothetical protein